MLKEFRIFQFHKGTIRTLQRVIGFQNRYYFNSIKVQLELTSHQKLDLFGIFQFHKGTIRTFYCFVAIFRDLDFNSIKVQLELANDMPRLIHKAISIP